MKCLGKAVRTAPPLKFRAIDLIVAILYCAIAIAFCCQLPPATLATAFMLVIAAICLAGFFLPRSLIVYRSGQRFGAVVLAMPALVTFFGMFTPVFQWPRVALAERELLELVESTRTESRRDNWSDWLDVQVGSLRVKMIRFLESGETEIYLEADVDRASGLLLPPPSRERPRALPDEYRRTTHVFGRWWTFDYPLTGGM